MQALRIDRPGVAGLVDLPLPEPGPHDAVVRVHACGICGTDVHIFRGEYLGDYPVIPGHEAAGEVVQVGAEVTRFRVGDRVAIEPNIPCDACYACLHNRQNFCLNWQAIGVTRPGAMAELVLVPEKALFDIGALPFEHGAFVEPLSCVLHGIEQASIRMGDRVAILGAGPIGLLLLQAVRLQGAVAIDVLERQAARGSLAQAYGAARVVAGLEELEADHYDVVIDATGVPGLMASGPKLARRGGTVLLFGVPPRGSKLALDAFALFEKGLTLCSSFTSLRNSYQAIALLQSGQIVVSDLISHRLPLSSFERGITLIEQGLEDVRKVLLLPHLPA